MLAFAVGFRAAAFVPDETPPLSTDVHRYAWDARVQANGINPYRFAPIDAALRPLRDRAVFTRVNLPRWHTVYPPGAEAAFLAARGIFGTGLRSTTWLFLAGEAVAAALLVLVLARMSSRPPLERVAAYAWHPLAISEIAANGHVDALAVTALAALLAAWQARRFALAGVAVALAALVKLGSDSPRSVTRQAGRPLVRRHRDRRLRALLHPVSLGGHGGLRGSRRVRTGAAVRQRGVVGARASSRRNRGDRVSSASVFSSSSPSVALREHDDIEQVSRSCLLVLGTLLLVVSYVQPWHALWLLPFFAIVVAPGWLWLTGALPILYVFELDSELPIWVRPVVYGPLALWILWRIVSTRTRRTVSLAPLGAQRVAAVIPTLNEGATVPGVLREFPAGVVDEVIVVDGGSQDGTVQAAERAGARVVEEARRGYGRACATGAAATDSGVIVFLDGDGSDDPAALRDVLRPILDGDAALVLGARRHPEPGALELHQRLGNGLVALLVRSIYGVSVHDVPPMRAIRRDALTELELREMTYGWPTEMLVKAARAGLPIVEVGVPCRARRGGESKIAGRAVPSAKAGARMLAVVARYA